MEYGTIWIAITAIVFFGGIITIFYRGKKKKQLSSPTTSVRTKRSLTPELKKKSKRNKGTVMSKRRRKELREGRK